MPRIPMPVLHETGSNFADGWARIMRWSDAHFPELGAGLRSGASEAQISAAEAALGIPFPEDLRALYREANGDAAPEPGFFFGLQFLSLDRLVEEWRGWTEILTEDPGINADIADQTSTPPGAIAELYINPGWIPIAFDHGGNHLGVDLAPGPRGRIGQVINFGTDEGDKFVIAPSVATFMDWFAQNLEAGNYHIAMEEHGPVLSIADPENEHFLDAVRDLGNAC